MKKFIRRLLFWFLISLLFFVAYSIYILDDAKSISKGFHILQYEQQKTALLIIDVQMGTTGNLSQDQIYVEQSKELIRNINKAISIASEEKVDVVYIKQQTENWLLNMIDGYALAKGSPGVELDDRLKLVSINYFTKRKSDAFSSHGFDIFLNAMKINRLIVTGLDIAYCAYRTSYAGLNRGYEVIIIEDAVISESEELKKEKLKELTAKGAVVINSDQLSILLDAE